jgi:ATP-dependent helicase HepA
MSFVIGQRWLSHADPQLGLGIVLAVETRRVTIEFPATEEQRTYALDNAPLSRIVYRSGETILNRENRELTVSVVNELRGIMIYTAVDAEGREHAVAEQELSARVQFSAPLQRLGSGPSDNNTAFELRLETLEQRQRLQQAPAAGLLGARTSLLRHQVYIAQQVAQRYAPRVLLADEVGLGKTIEAGLIVHQQLHAGRAQRVLVLVPPALQHQWLVEMLRRFNLRFSLFDAERYAAAAEDATTGNTFDSEQLIICSIDWLANAPDAMAAALAAEWDLVVVDEAHHLHWSAQSASVEYTCVEQLAQRSAGLILLTATPEQAGIDSHFARLRLLDPARFHSLEHFKAEAADYRSINIIVQQLQQAETLDAQLLAPLRAHFADTTLLEGADKNVLIQRLLDRHGTGRALFRNTRHAVGGFPERHVQAAPLPLPELYAEHTGTLYPEREVGEAQWLKSDPRVAWLEGLLKKIRPAKALIICAHAETALALEQYLHLRAGIRSAAFHEGLTLLERDRAAAWFAETELGAQALVCSEIGSEGRNFQFAQHLVLFDLPLNPDLLEQRIGRLDRIGQGPRIDIHVPYLEDSAQEIVFRWYHEGMNLFRQTFAGGYAIYERFAERLQQQSSEPRTAKDSGACAQLLADTQQQVDATRIALQEGRDALLELNSCNNEIADALIESIRSSEHSAALQTYMERVWDHFGVDHEKHSEHSVVVRPSEQMLVSQFPELSEDGFTATFDRAQALQRDDMEFLTWEHPMVLGAIEMILGAEYGNAAIASMNVKGLPPGTLLLEAIYSVQCIAPRQLQLPRFLPNTPLRFLVDRKGKNLSAVLPHEKLNALCSNIPRSSGPAIIAQVRTEIAPMQEHAARFAAVELPELIAAARARLTDDLEREIARLEALRAVNPAIRAEEIEFFRAQLASGQAAIEQASLQLQALRLIVNT